jgi:energy-coupling factor transport system substrate-specific component
VQKKTINYRWRVVDIVVAAVIGVAAALIYFAWNNLYGAVTLPLSKTLPGSEAVLYGVWLFGGVLGGIVIRKPGAALFTELVAAIVSAGLGAQWGWLTVEAGLVQGLGAEIVFAIFLYRNWSLVVAMLAGALSGLAMAVNDITIYYRGYAPSYWIAYGIGGVISGAVIAGLGSWLILRGLAKTGVLSRFSSGRARTA